MKKTTIIALMSFLTLNVFSQQFPYSVHILNVDPNCPVTVAGSYTLLDSNVTYPIDFINDSGSIPWASWTWYTEIPESGISISICAIDCIGTPVCIDDTLPFGTQGEIYYISTEPIFEDMDDDGYLSIEFGGNDCNDYDPFTYPGALEACDGVDNNCDGVLNTPPTISMYFVPDSLVSEPNTIYVVCQTSGANFWGWDWGLASGVDSLSLYTSFIYDSPGTYTPCLYAFSPVGCMTDSCLTFTTDSTGWFPGGIMSQYTLHIVPEYGVGIEELSISKKLVKVLDETGRDAIPVPNRLFIYVYDDGSREKKVIIKE